MDIFSFLAEQKNLLSGLGSKFVICPLVSGLKDVDWQPLSVFCGQLLPVFRLVFAGFRNSYAAVIERHCL